MAHAPIGMPTAGVYTLARSAERRNEDAAALADTADAAQRARCGSLYVLADGMGGHRGGAQASALAVSTLFQTFYDDPRPDRPQALRAAIEAANTAVYRQAQQPETLGMGATIVAALVQDGQLIVAHAGDSRAYLVRGGAAEQLTQDHNWGNEVLPTLTAADEITAHPYRRVLTRAVGGDSAIDVDMRALALAAGDRVILATDGVTNVVPPADIARLALESPPQAAQALVLAAADSNDDRTAIVIDTTPPPPPTAHANLRPVLLGVGIALLVFAALAGVGLTRRWLSGAAVAGSGAPTAPAATGAMTAPTPAGTPRAFRRPGDVTGDGKVDLRDLTRVGVAFGQQPVIDRDADLNGDGKIDILDLTIVAGRYDNP